MMKRVITLIITVFLLSQSALATEVDLKDMTLEDLIPLRIALVQELMDRGELKSATVPAGDYTVGTDIPAGSYSISTSQVMVSVVINEYEELFVVTPDNGVGKITLEEGDVFTCSSTIELQKYAGLSFE